MKAIVHIPEEFVEVPVRFKEVPGKASNLMVLFKSRWHRIYRDKPGKLNIRLKGVNYEVKLP